MAKLTPLPSQVAPSGAEVPGKTRMAGTMGPDGMRRGLAHVNSLSALEKVCREISMNVGGF